LQTVFEFYGCYFHGCNKCRANKNADGTLKEINSLNEKKLSDLWADTENKEKMLSECGYTVGKIWECEWHHLKKRPEVLEYIQKLKCVKSRRQLSYQKILNGIKDDSLFGLLFVDVETPPDLKKELEDFPVVIKNSDVSRQDIGPYMQQVSEEHGYLKKTQRSLVIMPQTI